MQGSSFDSSVFEPLVTYKVLLIVVGVVMLRGPEIEISLTHARTHTHTTQTLLSHVPSHPKHGSRTEFFIMP